MKLFSTGPNDLRFEDTRISNVIETQSNPKPLTISEKEIPFTSNNYQIFSSAESYAGVDDQSSSNSSIIDSSINHKYCQEKKK